jgi:hypothetical protein
MLLAVAAAPWVFAVKKLSNGGPVTSSTTYTQPHSIVWANRVFSSKAGLSAWLVSRGTAYELWASRHPGDAAIVEHLARTAGSLPARAPKVKTSASQPQVPATAAHSLPEQTPTPSAHSGGSGSWLELLLLGAAVMAMLAAATPAALARVVGGEWLSSARRAYMFALGLSVCVGLLMSGAHF